MQTINPGLFARLMRLPDAARADILGFVGATPLGDAQLSAILDSLTERADATEARGGRQLGRA